MAKNGIYEGFMIVSDMDGTLLNSNLEVSTENIRALERFVKGGGIFTIATGRMEIGIEKYLKLLPVNAPVILYNGALVYDFNEGRMLRSKCLDTGVKSVLSDIRTIFPTLGIEVFQGGDVYFLEENEETEKHRIKEGFVPKVVSIEEIPDPWYKVILTTRPDRLTEVEKFISGRDKDFRMVYSEPQFLELLHRNASKGTALVELSGITGIPMDNILSIGDNCNDLEMVSLSGMGFAVENSHSRLKGVARYICCHHDKHAAQYVVAWLTDKISSKGY
jgi:Cof subfamily protein (haloacid dehalogenase superfamily)